MTARPTAATIGLVVLLTTGAVVLSGWLLGALVAGGVGVTTGIVLGGGLRLHRRSLPLSVVLATVAVSLGVIGVVGAAGMGALAAYNSFGTRSVAPAALLARVSTFLVFVAGTILAGAGLALLGRPTPDSRAAAGRSHTLFAWLTVGVVATYAVLTLWLLWDLVLLNAAAVGIEPGALIGQFLFATAATGPHVGPLLAVLAVAGTAVALAISRTSATVYARLLGGERGVIWVERVGRAARWTAVVAALGTLPAGLLDTIGGWPSSVGGVPLEQVLFAVSTSPVLRWLLLAVTAVAICSSLLWLAVRVDWRRLAVPVAVTAGAVAGPAVLRLLVDRTEIVPVIVDRSPPDAAQSIELLVDELGAFEVLVAGATGGAAVVAIVVLVWTIGATTGVISPGSNDPLLAGAGGLVCGVAAVAHGGPSLAGLLAAGAGFLAWWTGTFGRGLADAAGPTGPTTVEFVHAGASVLAVAAGIVVVSTLGLLFDLTGTAPETAGVGTLLALAGIALLALSIRRRSEPAAT